MSETTHDRVPTREGYDRWSAVYDGDGNPLIAIEQPVFDELLGDPAGLDLLDVGCGTGRHAVALAKAGARVTAVDFSEGMLAQARQKAGDTPLRFMVHDIHEPLALEDDTFDRVICCLVLDHVADLDLLFGEMARVCRANGAIVITVMHPAMMLKGVQARFDDPEGGGKVVLDSVPNEVSDYVRAAVGVEGVGGAGLRIDHISEHAVPESLVEKSARAERYVGWPMLFAMRLMPKNHA